LRDKALALRLVRAIGNLGAELSLLTLEFEFFAARSAWKSATGLLFANCDIFALPQ
jgi:hypothetical protein